MTVSSYIDQSTEATTQTTQHHAHENDDQTETMPSSGGFARQCRLKHGASLHPIDLQGTTHRRSSSSCITRTGLPEFHDHWRRGRDGRDHDCGERSTFS